MQFQIFAWVLILLVLLWLNDQIYGPSNNRQRGQDIRQRVFDLDGATGNNDYLL